LLPEGSLSYHPLFIRLLGISATGLLPGIFISGLLPRILVSWIIHGMFVDGLLSRISVKGLQAENMSSGYYLEICRWAATRKYFIMLLPRNMSAGYNPEICQRATTQKYVIMYFHWRAYHQGAHLNLEPYQGATTQPKISWGNYNSTHIEQ